MRTIGPALRALLLAVVTACASSGAPGTARLAPRALSSGSDPITEADIAATNAASAYDAIVRLRAQYLRMHGINSVIHAARSIRPVVFVDGQEIGPIWELRSIPARDVHEIRYLSAADATIRYGEGYVAGIIHVLTKR